MGTKLRKFRTHILKKEVAFVIAVIMITAAAMQIPLARSTGIGYDCIKYIIIGIIFAFLSIFLTLYLIFVTGKRDRKEKIHLTVVDKIYSDIVILAYLFLLRNFHQPIWDSIFYPSISKGFELFVRCSVTSLFVSFSLFIILFIERKAKTGSLIRYSLSYKLVQFYQYLFSEDLFHTESHTKTLYYRQLITGVVISISFLLTIVFALAHSPLLLVPMILFVLIIYWYVKGNEMIYKNIDKGIEESLEEQMKSERMKVALITNVSHDLKTPLTSIVSYVDLLSKEDGLSEVSKDYIKILQNKSERLTNIVTDLFELAKSTSGNIKLDKEKIDLKKLLEQTLADMEDKIRESELIFKTKFPEVPVIILSDGNKLYRVFQNIIDNALKYSLKNTRVYIDLEILDQKAIVTVKNIASYEMNFTEEEILQRFYRGDQSRTTEGSGLGLSIAESFTCNCGGKLDVTIDGDVFKVMITFDLSEVSNK